MALPPFFDPIVNAPKPYKIAVGVVGLVLIGVGAYFLLLSPLQARVAQLQTEYASLETELTQSRAIVAELARFRREIAQLENRLAVLKERLPTEKEIPPLYRALTDAAHKSGLAVALFQPREPRARDYYSEIPITIQSEGGYHQLGEFFEHVAKLPRVVNVADLKLSVRPATPAAAGRPGAAAAPAVRHPMRADLTLATYMYRAPGAPAPKPAGAKK